MVNLTGQTIGQYRIMEQIGQGGMATVYKAFQPSMERYVAIKVLPEQLVAQDSTFIERFRQEAKAIAQLEHPHILPVYDYGEAHGLTYMVMRYMDSGTLTSRFKKPIEVAEVIRLLGQVAEALDYTHSRGIVHRDIKPSNILIDARGEALLTDFGIAKLVEGTGELTRHGVVGTPTYMSPEQAQGQPVDGRSDIYSLGIILYEALVGHPPFEAETPVALLMKHVHATLPIPRTIKPEINPALEKVILKALAKNPADRYQKAGEMKRAMETALIAAGQGLTQFSAAPPAAPAPTPALTAQVNLSEDRPVEPHPGSRRPMMIGLVALLILGVALIGGTALWVFQGNERGLPEQSLGTTVAGGETSTPAAATEAPTTAATETQANETTVTGEATETPAPAVSSAGAGEPAQVAPTNTPLLTSTLVEPSVTLTAVATVAPALPPTPTPAQLLTVTNVTGNPGISDYPHLALDGEGILHLAWWDNSTGKTSGDILHRQMTPDGTWSEAEILSANFEITIHKDSRLIRSPAGQMCVFWWGGVNQKNPDSSGLHMRCQVEDSWSAAEMILQAHGNMRNFTPAFALDGTVPTLHIIGLGDLFFGDFELSDGLKLAAYPDFAIDHAGGYHVVWERQGDPFSIEYRYSSDNGQTWRESERLTDETNSGGNVWPLSLKADQKGNVHLVFVSAFRGIFYRRWTPAGGWETAIELTQGEASSNSTSIGLAVDSEGLAHVTWQGIGGMYYTQQSADSAWSHPLLLTEAVNTGSGPEVAVDDQGVRHFVWQVEDDALDLYYATLP